MSKNEKFVWRLAKVAAVCGVLALTTEIALAQPGNDSPDLEKAISAAPDGGTVELEAREYRLSKPVVVTARTNLVISGKAGTHPAASGLQRLAEREQPSAPAGLAVGYAAVARRKQPVQEKGKAPFGKAFGQETGQQPVLHDAARKGDACYACALPPQNAELAEQAGELFME